MNADTAFDKLIHKNALPIPVAKPSAEPQRNKTEGRIAKPTPVARPAGPVREPAYEKAVRVTDLLDEEPGDYRPRGGADTTNEENALYATPTETDLDPVDGDGDEIDSAAMHGARIVGRDAASEEDLYESDDGYARREPDGYDGVDGESGLDLARRVRRFAYLPLSGMEEFENRSRDLMASLQSQMADRPSLAITGVMHGDGQAELALRLALAMAKRVDYRVLLADFNLRQPQIANRLGLSSKHFALSDVLRESCPLGEALILGEEDNLYVLPARASDRDGDEVFDDRQVQMLLGQIHRTFDFTIIACGPMDHADATIICRHTGFAALAAYCGVSRARPLREAAERLAEAGARVAGLVLTGA